MPKIRLALVSVLTILVVSAVTSASAMAFPQYFVEISSFTGEEALQAQPKPGTVAVLTSKLTGGATIEIVCEGGKLNAAKIKEDFRARTESISYEKCRVKTPATCKVKATLTTNEVAAEAVDVGVTNVSEIFKPTFGEPFITITVTGCSGEGNYAVKGSAECELLEPAVEGVDKACLFTIFSGSSLKFGTNVATLTQETEFFLNGTKKGQKWTIAN